MKELAKISQIESNVVRALVSELQKADAALRSYVRHVITDAGHDPEKVGLAADLVTLVEAEPTPVEATSEESQ